MIKFDIDYHKLYKPFSNDLTTSEIWPFVKKILHGDRGFLYSTLIYSIIISLLGIAVPISVQFLINSVSFTALFKPIIILGIILLSLLVFSGILNAIQFYTVEIFQRRFMANMAAKLCKILINSDVKKLEESNATELVNRFFDVITVQKTVPKFLVKTISFLFQTIIGLLLVSFYHPFFLLFSVVLLVCLYLIYSLYFNKACQAAFFESRRKYDIVANFEDMANNIGIFKSQTGQNYAKFKTDELTSRYLVDRKAHFKSLFSQTILLLIVYALASTFLLILGGYLVLNGQLTIGQLVAAELILSAILYSLSQFGRDFENMYDLIAACEKLSIFHNIPQEKLKSGKPKIDSFKEISFEKISNQDSVINEEEKVSFNFKLQNHKKYLIHDRHQASQSFLVNMLRDFERPSIGEVRIDGENFYNFDMLDFRNQIKIIDSKPLMEGTLLENITLGRKDIEKGRINQILKDLGLDKAINKYEEKLNLRTTPSGWPLNEQQVVLIKIVRALVFDAQIIIANEILDIIDFDLRQKVLKYIADNSDAMIIYFSNHKDDNTQIFDHIMEI